MTHCGCDPEFEASPSPLFFLPFLWEWLSCLPLLTVRSLAFEGVSLSEAYCLGPVTAWAAESSDTAWIHSFIIRQMGWSRCGPCGRVPRQAPYHPTPMLASTEGAGRSACSWVKRAPRLPLPLAHSAPLFLSVSAAPSHPQWGKGGTLLSQNTHTKFECWIWQRLWNKGRLRREIKKKSTVIGRHDSNTFLLLMWHNLKMFTCKTQILPPTLAFIIQLQLPEFWMGSCLCDGTSPNRNFHKAPPPTLPLGSLPMSARYCMGHPATAPSLWTPRVQPPSPPSLVLSFQNEIRQL